MTAGDPLSTAHLPRPDPSRGVFETVLLIERRPVALNAHLSRLGTSGRELFGPPATARVFGPARALLVEGARDLAPSALGRTRLTLAPTEDGQLELSATTEHVGPTSLLATVEPATAVVPVTVAGGLGRHKWVDRRLLDGVLDDADGALPLLLDEDGTVLEASRANVFAVVDGGLVTPPDDGRILPGVARATMMDVARRLGIDFRQREMSFDELRAADEVFLTGSIRGVEAAMFDGVPADGPVTARVAAELSAVWLAVPR